MTEKVVCHVVKEFTKKVGIANLAPHDLHSYAECARLCYAAGGEQIQFLLARFGPDDRALSGLQAANPVRRQ